VVWGSGKAQREFLYSEDMASIVKEIHVRGIETAPALMTVSPGCVHEIAEIVEMIVKHIGFNGKVVFDSTKMEGIIKKNTDNSLFRKYLPDFKFTDINTGLSKTIEHFVKNYDTVRK
jgi:GDP-L-fucose synthase